MINSYYFYYECSVSLDFKSEIHLSLVRDCSSLSNLFNLNFKFKILSLNFNYSSFVSYIFLINSYFSKIQVLVISYI